MSNHTPGPWTARRMACQTDSHTYNSEVVTSEGGEYVAGLLRKADAQLIAAASELLEALDSLVSACDLPGDHCEVEQALPRAIAAIKKAKGES
jgi:hypothetical protein